MGISLEKDEIYQFTEEYLNHKGSHELNPDKFVLQTWIEFMQAHELNPRVEQSFLFSAPNEEAWEGHTKYIVRWIPKVSLHISGAEFRGASISIIREAEGSGNGRTMQFLANISL